MHLPPTKTLPHTATHLTVSFTTTGQVEGWSTSQVSYQSMHNQVEATPVSHWKNRLREGKRCDDMLSNKR